MASLAFFIGPGILAGVAAQKQQDDYQEEVCKETNQMALDYTELYNESVSYIREQTMASRRVQDSINKISADITQSAQNLKEIQKRFKFSMAIINVGLLLSVLATAILLYLKHKGLLTLNPLANS